MALPLYPGCEDFKELREGRYLYVDKTSCLKEFFAVVDRQDGPPGEDKVLLFTRPRRFGKTFTMSMIESFFALNYQNPEDKSLPQSLFAGLDIMKDEAFCREHLGQYPVINLSLKEVDGVDFKGAMAALAMTLSNLYQKFDWLLDLDKLGKTQKASLKDLIGLSERKARWDAYFARNRSGTVQLFKDSLFDLSSMLCKATDRKVMVLVDEYDVPLQKAKAKGYYREMLDVIRGMLGKVFKTNEYLFKGIVTGCLRISRESIFTGINNFSVYTTETESYRNFIGFTKDEVHDILKERGLDSRESEVIAWYEGYNFSGLSMLCPWSVLKFCFQATRSASPLTYPTENYWANTSGNDIIDICIQRRSERDSLRLQNLIDGNTETIPSPQFTTYPDLDKRSSLDDLLGLMLHTGYVTAVEKLPDSYLRVRIPNQEVLSCFKEKVRYLFSISNQPWFDEALSLRKALFSGDKDKVQELINDMLLTFISIRDYSQEYYYHAFLVGVLSMTSNDDMSLDSEQESGKGYSDIRLSHKLSKRAVIIELKKLGEQDEVDAVCQGALAQIEECKYAYPFEQKGYEIFKYGIVFTGKECRVMAG